MEMSSRPGLSRAQVEAARRRYGSNAFTRQSRKTFFTRFFESFSDPIIRILLVALGLNLLKVTNIKISNLILAPFIPILLYAVLG